MGGELKEVFSLDIPQQVLHKFDARRGDSKHTTLWEAPALLIACRTWLGRFVGVAKVHCRSDSLSLLQTLLKGRAKATDLAKTAREFALDLARDWYRLHLLTHIPGVTNLEADALIKGVCTHFSFTPKVSSGDPKSKCQARTRILDGRQLTKQNQGERGGCNTHHTTEAST